jgi:four helix bundle protein
VLSREKLWKLRMAYRSFEDLDVWKRSCQLAVKIYELLQDCRDFGLKDQMTRSAVSVPSNISEGCERASKPDFIRFLHIAKGSAAELRTQVYIANKVGLLSSENKNEIVLELKEISSMLQGLINHNKS